MEYKKYNKLVNEKRNRLTNIENKLVIAIGKREAGRENEGQGMKRHKLPVK